MCTVPVSGSLKVIQNNKVRKDPSKEKGLKTSWAFYVELSTFESVNVKRKKDTFRVTIVDSRQCDVQIAFYANLFSSLVNRLVNIQV
jgi:hypothetical protein